MQNENIKRNWAHNDERINISNDEIEDHCNNNQGVVSSGTPLSTYNVAASGSVPNSPSTIGTVSSSDQRNLGSLSPKSHTSSSSNALLTEKLTSEAVDNNFSGYNSGDEYAQAKDARLTATQWRERDDQFIKCMTDRGFTVKQVEEDGACLFRSISLQIYGDEDMHDVIRQNTMDYIVCICTLLVIVN